jgi:hypothetical protein
MISTSLKPYTSGIAIGCMRARVRTSEGHAVLMRLALKIITKIW